MASVDVLGADGTVETITGTTIHPVWSVDRQSWVPLVELADGETLQGLDGLAVVLSVSLSRVTQPVYNIEVHGEHVYQVGELGLVVHNACEVLVSRWGREGLKHGDWVMKGAATPWNYLKSFKWERTPFNNPAAFNTGREYTVNASELIWPTGWQRFKGIFGQRIYVGSGL